MKEKTKFKLLQYGKYTVGLVLVVHACKMLGAYEQIGYLVRQGYTILDKNGNECF